MKTKFLLVALAISLGGAISANAQIPTGEPSAKVIRTGNRAKAGNFGLYIGATTSMFGNMFKDDVDMHPLPLLNFKYMATNSMEFRVGLEAYKLTERLKGEISQNKSTIASKNKYGESTLILYPGFAYHFSKLNILDVYRMGCNFRQVHQRYGRERSSLHHHKEIVCNRSRSLHRTSGIHSRPSTCHRCGIRSVFTP